MDGWMPDMTVNALGRGGQHRQKVMMHSLIISIISLGITKVFIQTHTQSSTSCDECGVEPDFILSTRAHPFVGKLAAPLPRPFLRLSQSMLS